jgi:Ca2+/Na+ antiporter
VTLAFVLLVLGAVIAALGSRMVLRAGWRLVAPPAERIFAHEVVAGLTPAALMTVIAAAARQETSVAAGAALGVVGFLLAAVFGGSLVVARRPLPSPPLTVLLFPAGILLAAAVTMADLVVTRAEGLGLLGAFGVYVLVAATTEPTPPQADPDHGPIAAGARGRTLLGAAIGLGLLFVAATLVLAGTGRVLDRTTLTGGFVGAVLVASATSLREAVQTRRSPDAPFRALPALAAGAVGIAALVRPLVVDATAVSAALSATALYAVVCSVFLIQGHVWRMTGLVVLGLYGAWLYLAATA